MSDKEKLEAIKAAFIWCVNNTEDCEGTEYHKDIEFDNWYRMSSCLEEVFSD